MPEIFIDTNVGIKRIENTKNGTKIRTYLSGKTLFTSTYVLMEFKRTILKDAVSLYTMLQEGATLDDTHRRINKMLDDRTTSKIASRWVILLGLLGYPQERDKIRTVKSLEYLIRKGLVFQFLHEIQLLQSRTKCSSAGIKPTKREGKYELNMECSMNNCDIKSTIIANRGVFEDILTRIIDSREDYFKELSDIINETLNDADNMKEEYCNRLGDVVVAIDCPNEMELCTSDHHFNIICEVIGKSRYDPLTS